MNKIAILTDSGAYVPGELLEQYDIHVIPLVVLWGKETLRDGVDITVEKFHERLQQDAVHPTTTQPNPDDFARMYAELAGDYDGIVAVLISSNLSGTYNSATTAAAEFDAVPVRIVDTRSTSMGEGFAVLAAARAAAAGKSIDEIAAAAEAAAAGSHVMFAVDTLEYLHKGGRIGGAARLLGTALSLKPLLHLEDGRVEALERVRTKQKAVNRMVELTSMQTNGQAVRLAVIHANAPDEAEQLKQVAEVAFNCAETYTADLSPAIAVHAGPGTLGLVICPVEAA